MPAVLAPKTAKAYLARAETNIIVEEARIARLTAHVDRLRSAGKDARLAAWRLEHFRVSVECWREHRAEIISILKRATNLPPCQP